MNKDRGTSNTMELSVVRTNMHDSTQSVINEHLTDWEGFGFSKLMLKDRSR